MEVAKAVRRDLGYSMAISPRSFLTSQSTSSLIVITMLRRLSARLNDNTSSTHIQIRRHYETLPLIELEERRREAAAIGFNLYTGPLERFLIDTRRTLLLTLQIPEEPLLLDYADDLTGLVFTTTTVCVYLVNLGSQLDNESCHRLQQAQVVVFTKNGSLSTNF